MAIADLQNIVWAIIQAAKDANSQFKHVTIICVVGVLALIAVVVMTLLSRLSDDYKLLIVLPSIISVVVVILTALRLQVLSEKAHLRRWDRHKKN